MPAHDHPHDGLTVAEMDAEDRMIDHLIASGTLDRDPGYRPVLPPNLESWPVDFRLAILLDHLDPGTLTDADRVRYVKACERLTAHTQAAGLSGIRAIAQSYGALDIDDPEDVVDGVCFELRGALRWTRRFAENELDLAVDLLDRLPSVYRALAAGRIDRPRAEVVRNGSMHLTVAHARAVADTVLEDAPRLTTGQLAGRVRRAALEVDPDAVRAEAERAHADRRFVTWTAPDGTMGLQLTGIDPVRGQELADRINRIARELRRDGDTRTMDQLRADVAADLLCGTTRPTVGTIHLTVGLTDLFDPDVLAAADLAGYGPILSDIARQFVTDRDGTWNWTVAHPASGMPIADGHTRRRHTASQRRRLAVRHSTCVAPGCRMPTIGCDIDHTTPYAESGVTDSTGSAPLCRHDHCVRHQTGWTYEVREDGDVVWTSPLGTTYTTSGRDP